MMFAVRASILKELMADREWSSRLEGATTTRDVERVVTRFCRAKGYKVEMLKAATQK